ncbi:hypothetical protein [Caproicibacter fermentans]|uniref:hypothetical protein n=1 Tax=Caproicibacter fermentans TaxID=2576756 RepID=UPI0012EE381B|nr:hypothetical protein [Caproicibacter fermentans]
MSDDSKRIVLPKTLQERMLKFFLKAQCKAMEADLDGEKDEPPQNPINKDDRSSG